MKGKHFLKLLDFTSTEIEDLLNMAADFKEQKKNRIPHKIFPDKNIVLLFEKDSTRTRCAFKVACADLGMAVTYLGPSGSHTINKRIILIKTPLWRMYRGCFL